MFASKEFFFVCFNVTSKISAKYKKYKIYVLQIFNSIKGIVRENFELFFYFLVLTLDKK